MSDPASLLVFERVPPRLRRTVLKAHALRLVQEVSGGREFNCLLSGDERLRRLNRTWRGKDEPTDVLSFPAPQLPPALLRSMPAASLGELAISCGRARAQAAEHGHSLEEEISILMLHGLLHLMGMDHETDKGQMRRAETRWRRRLGLPTGLIERAGRPRKGRAA